MNRMSDRGSIPEMALVAAVLYQAAKDVRIRSEKDESGRKYSPREKALRWIEDEDKRSFSFNWCCTVLGLSPEWARKKIVDGETFEFRSRGKLSVLPEKDLENGLENVLDDLV